MRLTRSAKKSLRQRGGGKVKDLLKSEAYGEILQAIFDDNVDAIDNWFTKKPNFDINSGIPLDISTPFNIKDKLYDNIRNSYNENSINRMTGNPLIAYTFSQETSGLFKQRRCELKINAFINLMKKGATLYTRVKSYDKSTNTITWTPGIEHYMKECNEQVKKAHLKNVEKIWSANNIPGVPDWLTESEGVPNKYCTGKWYYFGDLVKVTGRKSPTSVSIERVGKQPSDVEENTVMDEMSNTIRNAYFVSLLDNPIEASALQYYDIATTFCWEDMGNKGGDMTKQGKYLGKYTHTNTSSSYESIDTRVYFKDSNDKENFVSGGIISAHYADRGSNRVKKVECTTVGGTRSGRVKSRKLRSKRRR
jgi:hypothetical protein